MEIKDGLGEQINIGPYGEIFYKLFLSETNNQHIKTYFNRIKYNIELNVKK
jgi:hypothetical protein